MGPPTKRSATLADRSIEPFIGELYSALRGQYTVAPLSERNPNLTIDDAYAISLGVLERREADGERLIGKKIGLTSKAVQDMLGVHQPDFGFLTNRMRVRGEVNIEKSGLIQPRAEAEIAFVLATDLTGPGITAQDVLDSTASIVPCFEIVDSRIRDWKIGIVDTIADNASCGVFALGDKRADPHRHEFAGLHITVMKNGNPVSDGYGRDVQGSPLEAVAWLANTLSAYGVPLCAGDLILSGSMVPLELVRAGDRFDMMLEGVGGCSITFS